MTDWKHFTDFFSADTQWFRTRQQSWPAPTETRQNGLLNSVYGKLHQLPVHASGSQSKKNMQRCKTSESTPACVVLLGTSGTQLRSSIQTQLTSSAADSSRLSAAQSGFTAQPCIHAERQLIASSLTVGDERKLRNRALYLAGAAVRQQWWAQRH